MSLLLQQMPETFLSSAVDVIHAEGIKSAFALFAVKYTP